VNAYRLLNELPVASVMKRGGELTLRNEKVKI